MLKEQLNQEKKDLKIWMKNIFNYLMLMFKGECLRKQSWEKLQPME